jgi:hypothetical protein
VRGQACLVATARGRVRREVNLVDGCVTVTDTILHDSVVRYQACWLLHPEADVSQINGNDGKWCEAADDSVVGWYSPRYGERLRSRALMVDRPVRRGDRIVVRINAATAAGRSGSP